MRLFMQIKKEELKKTVLLPKAIYVKKGGAREPPLKIQNLSKLATTFKKSYYSAYQKKAHRGILWKQ